MTSIDILWYSRSPHPSPLGLAAQLGWFLDEFRDDGISVFTLQDSASAELRDSHIDHHLPNSIRQGGNVPALWARSRGAPTRLIGLSWLDEFQAVIALPGSGIHDPADLAGRRLALPVYGGLVDSRRAEALHGFLHTLGHAGLQASDARFVDIAADRHWQPMPGQRLPHGLFGEYARQIGALLRHEVDAVYVKGARGLQAARTAQARVLLDLREHPDPEARVHTGTPRPITVDSGLLERRPDLVERFLARIVAAGAWAAQHPRETVAYLGRETRCHQELVPLAYGHDVHRHLGTDLSPRALAALASHQRFLRDWGFLSREVDVAAWVDPAPLAAATRRLAGAEVQAL